MEVLMRATLVAVLLISLYVEPGAFFGALASSSSPYEDPEEASQQQSAVSDYIREFGCNAIIHNRSTVIEECLKRTLQFFRKYLTRLDKGKTFGVCRRFQDVQDCLEPLLKSCPVFRQKYFSVLQPVIEYFKCACSYSGECKENLQCFEVEYRGILSRRCDDYYKFNIQQKTHKNCYFLQEKIDCKVALVTTACDIRTGEFAYHMYRFIALSEAKTSSCDVVYTPVDLYEGFYYDDNCPTYFLQDLATCSSNHLWNQMLKFDEDNDLVARGNKKTVQKACRSYKLYRKCIRHPRKACKLGTKEVFNYGINLRKYALKMDYICQKTTKTDYMDSLSCYQDVLVNKSLNQCDYIYSDLRPWLESVTAFMFYCKDNSEEVMSMNLELSRLRSCYEDIFRLNCGDLAGVTMGKMIELAFQDPAYLRYSYRPDCHLHRKSGRLKRLKNSPQVPEDLVTLENVTTVVSSSGIPQRQYLKSNSLVLRIIFVTLFFLLESDWTSG